MDPQFFLGRIWMTLPPLIFILRASKIEPDDVWFYFQPKFPIILFSIKMFLLSPEWLATQSSNSWGICSKSSIHKVWWQPCLSSRIVWLSCQASSIPITLSWWWQKGFFCKAWVNCQLKRYFFRWGCFVKFQFVNQAAKKYVKTIPWKRF